MTNIEKGKAGEDYVIKKINKSLSEFWSFPNPKDERGDKKEICDLLILFKDNCFLFEIKNYDFKGDYERYFKKTIEKGKLQLQGAERKLFNYPRDVYINHPLYGLHKFDKNKYKNIFRIVIHLGDDLLLSYPGILNGKNKKFIHIFTKVDFEYLISNLTTFSDLSEYLNTREELLTKPEKIIISGGEKGFLGLFLTNREGLKNYVHKNIRKYLMLDIEDYWSKFQDEIRFKEDKEIHKANYVIDDLVHSIMGSKEGRVIGEELMTLNRFERKLVGLSFLGFCSYVTEKNLEYMIRQHMVFGGLAVTFLYCPDIFSDKIIEELMGTAAEGYSLNINFEFTNSIVFGIVKNKPIKFTHVNVDKELNVDELKKILDYLNWFKNDKKVPLNIEGVLDMIDTEGVIPKDFTS